MNPNRDALKKISDMLIDAQFAHKIGVQVFNGSTDIPNYHELCMQLLKICDDIQKEATELMGMIPVRK